MFLNLALDITFPFYPPALSLHLFSLLPPFFYLGCGFYCAFPKLLSEMETKILNYRKPRSSLELSLCLLVAFYLQKNKRKKSLTQTNNLYTPFSITQWKFACIDRLRGIPCPPMRKLSSLPIDQWKGGVSSWACLCPSPLFSTGEEEQHLINMTASAIMMFLDKFRFLFSCWISSDREQDKVRDKGWVSHSTAITTRSMSVSPSDFNHNPIRIWSICLLYFFNASTAQHNIFSLFFALLLLLLSLMWWRVIHRIFNEICFR